MKNWLLLAAAVLVTLPGLYGRLAGIHLPAAYWESVLFGVAILGSAFLLSWASEVAQMDIPPSLSLAVLAIIAVLPEYAVDLYFAWTAAKDPAYMSYAAANMTGANRLLIGIAWPLIFFLFWTRSRKDTLVLLPANAVELAVLLLATVYSFAIYLKASISLVDSIPLVGLFGLYLWISSRAPVEEPELLGPPASIATLNRGLRRACTVFLFLLAGGVILASAEPFAESLLKTGRVLQVDEFLLVQWLAPLASEAPEIVVACIFTLRGHPNAAMTAMISSKVNQWTLLVGTLPVVFSISAGAPGALVLDFRQQEEFVLTSAQSLFAVALLASLRMRPWEALAIFLLFATQLVLPDPRVRLGFAGLYVALTLGLVVLFRDRMRSFVGLIPSAIAAFRTAQAHAAAQAAERQGVQTQAK